MPSKMPSKMSSKSRGMWCGLPHLTVVLAWAGSMFLVSTTIISANVFDYYVSSSAGGYSNLFVLAVFVVGITVVWQLMIRSAYYANRRRAYASLVVMGALLVYWLALCVISFAVDQDIVCIDFRCPESLWIANTRGAPTFVPKIALFILTLLFLLFTVYMIWSWAKILKRIEKEKEAEGDIYFRKADRSSPLPAVMVVDDGAAYPRKSRLV